MKKSFRMILMLVAMLMPATMWAQGNFQYLCDFDDPADTAGWQFVHSSTSTGWCIDSTVSFNGTHSMFVTNPSDTTHPYSYNTSEQSAAYAYREIELPTGLFTLSYQWRCQGEGSYDYLRVFLAPHNATLRAGLLPDGTTSSYNFRTALPPQGWIALDGGTGLNGQASWQQYTTEFFVQADTFKLVFLWCCDGSAGTQPPAAVDSILIFQPDCSRPLYPTVTNLSSNTFDLSWIDVNGASEWLVELDSANQVQGQGSLQTVFDTVAYFSGLQPNTPYVVYVASICSGGDTSAWLRVPVRTPCDLLTTLPISESFENAAIGSGTSSSFVNCWYRLNNSAQYFGWPYVQSASNPHTGSRALYWYNSTGTAYGDYQCIVLPGVDTTMLPVNQLQLTFWATATSTSYAPELIIGVMSNPNDINTFVPVRTVIAPSTWTAFVTDFSTYTGTGNYVAIRANRFTSSWYAYVDDITLDRIPSCPTVCNVTVAQTGSAGAYVTWDLLSAGVGTISEYEVQIDSVGSTAHTTFTTTERNYLFSYLEPGTQYIVRVRAVCDNDSAGYWDSTRLTTFALPCAVPDPSSTYSVVFSNGTSSVSGVPVNSSWGNTVCQSIYTAAELNAIGLQAGILNGITLGYSAAGSYSKEITVYLGTTTRNTFGSTADQLPMNQMTKVLGPVVRPNNSSSVGWVNYTFTTPFTWDGVSNLVVTIFVNQHGGSHSNSGFYGYSTQSNATRTIYRYRDGTAYTADNCTSGTGNGTSVYRPSVSFSGYGCLQTATCARPLVMLTRNEADTVALRWAPGYTETSWTLMYKRPADTNWTVEATNIIATEYVFSTLSPNTEYMLRVYPSCGGDSIYTQLQFVTPCVAVDTLPFVEDFENFTATSVGGSAITSCWNRLSSYSGTASPYTSTSYAHGGIRSIYYYTPSTYHSLLVLPPFATSLDSLQVSFAAYKTSASYSITVGVMTDPTNYNTFTPVATVSPSQLNQWEMFEVLLDSCPASADAHYIAIGHPVAGSYNYMYLDDIEVNVIPPCRRPTNVAFRDITTTTAVVTWDGPAPEYEVEYGPVGFTRGTGSTLIATEDTVLLYGLDHSTRYEVYVRALCSTGDTSYWSFVTYFTTACSTIDTLPYKQNFSNWGVGTSARPACWTCSGSGSYPYILNVTNNNVVTGQAFYMYSGGTQTVASLPELDSVYVPANTVQVVFKAWSNATSTTYSRKLVVGLCADPANMNTFTPFDTVEVGFTPSMFDVAFDSVAGVGRYVTFVSQPLGGSYNNVYLDSVAVELIPACQAPNHLTSSNTFFTTTTLAWNARGTATTWQIEYGPAGFAHGTGIREIVTSNPYTLTNLNPSTTYNYYVRSICGTGDTSDWSRDAGEFTTQQIPATIPYFYDFEADTEWYNWQTNSNTSVNWYRDTAAGNGTNGYNTTGIHSMYVSADTGRSCSTNMEAVVNAVAYRDFDFGTDPYAGYTLSFRARSGGTTANAWDGLMVFFANPNIPVEASNANITSPWGDYTVLSPLVTIRCNANWNTYTVQLDTMTGVHRLVFFWFNQATGSQSPFIGAPASIDDVSITQVGCPRPTDVRTTAVSVTMADLDWNGPANATYRVHCRAVDGSAVFIDSVNTNMVHFSGLSPATRYSVQVRRLCSNTDSSLFSQACIFTTPLCTGGFTNLIGDSNSTTTSSYLPFCNSATYRYSYSQQIVRSNEISGSGEISAINFKYAGSSAITSKINCTIYMGHTSLSSFANDSSFVAPDSMQIVYVGRINATQGWNRIILHEPFPYNGVDNLVIAVDDNSNVTLSTSYTFYTSASSSTQGICFYSSTENPDPTSRATLNAFRGTRNVYGLRNVMELEICPPNLCPSPILRKPQVRTNSVTLRWRNTSDRYDFSYRRATTTSWIVDGLTLTDTVHVLTGLSPMTDYVYRVRKYCDSTGVSNWAYGRFNTGDLPCLPPETITIVSVTNTKVKLRWSTDENNIGYKLHVFNSVFDREISTYGASGTCNGLEAGVTYYAAVQTTCSGIDEPSEWSDTISFVTDVCPDVSNVTVSDVQGNTAVVDWTEGGRAEQWEIQYGTWGFGQGYGISVIADSHPFTLTGLVGSSTYDIYVRAICGTNFVSEHWAAGPTFTTLYSAIGSVVDDTRVRLYPNPTSADVELMIPAATDAVMVEVVDVTGRVCQRHTLQANTERFVIPASQLAQGTYFVRITGGDLNAVKKLIVR